MNPTVSLLMLRSADMAASLEFYRALGLQFIEEQHGTGPKHFSSEIAGLVIEIYPGEVGEPIAPKISGATMIGFQVESLEQTLENLAKLEIVPTGAPKDAPWGKWVNVRDPDGRVVQLTQPVKELL